MDEEVWKDIIIEKNGIIYNYKGHYQVSNYGRIKSIKNGYPGKIIKGNLSSNYIGVTLSKKGELQRFYVHRIVASVFIPNPNNYEQINHKDENTKNNNVDNLEWCTPKYNANYGTKTKRQSEKITGKKQLLKQKEECQFHKPEESMMKKQYKK